MAVEMDRGRGKGKGKGRGKGRGRGLFTKEAFGNIFGTDFRLGRCS